MIHKPFGYGIGLSKGDRFYPKERMPYPPDSWLVSVWVETGIIGLVLYLAVHGVLFAWCGMDTDVQDHEQTPARLTYCLALYRCRILSGSLCQRRDAISQLHPHIHSLCPLLRRTVH